MLTHRNTLAIVVPLVRWIRPSAPSAEIVQIHDMARKFGHFLIPAIAYALLILGPLRRRPLLALGLCALFAGIDELMQAFNSERTGSILDVILDTSGAVFAYFVYRAIVAGRRGPVARASSDRAKGRRSRL